MSRHRDIRRIKIRILIGYQTVYLPKPTLSCSWIFLSSYIMGNPFFSNTYFINVIRYYCNFFLWKFTLIFLPFILWYIRSKSRGKMFSTQHDVLIFLDSHISSKISLFIFFSYLPWKNVQLWDGTYIICQEIWRQIKHYSFQILFKKKQCEVR